MGQVVNELLNKRLRPDVRHTSAREPDGRDHRTQRLSQALVYHS